MITQVRDVVGFNEIVFQMFGDLTIEQADQESLTLEGDEELLAKVKTEVRDNRLTIRLEHDMSALLTTLTHHTVHCRVTLPELRAFDMSGAGQVTIPHLQAAQLQLHLSGAGAVKPERASH